MIVYCAPVSAVEGPLMTGAAGVVQVGLAGLTVNSAVAFAPPAPAGRVAVIVAVPTEEPKTVKLAEFEPPAISTEDGITAMPGFDDDNVTVVFDATLALVCTVYVVDALTSTARLFGRIASVRLVMLIAPLASVRFPPPLDSFVAPVPA